MDKKKYTVLYLWDDSEVSIAHVMAYSAYKAAEQVYDDTLIEGEYETIDDVPFTVISVFEGHLVDLYAKGNTGYGGWLTLHKKLKRKQ